MKLLELHIRNIASIVKADIDFEHDLIDPDTGLPAQKFLIYGDTGTGKSVLLDAIAMTLFNVTPRLREVADKVRNKYTDAAGRELSLNSLEQYTRLGIGSRDECYASTLFVGNDGRTYTATRRLGLTQRGRFRNEWVLCSEGQPDRTGTQCSEAIGQAIGMTYEQFSRMAMLAQGQFTSFLCGSRSERADILEKLTNTALFSTYGKAIQALAKQKSEAARELEIALGERKQQMLDPDEAERLGAVRDLAIQKRDCLKALIDRLQAQLDWLHRVETQHTLRSKAEADLAAAEAYRQSETYREQKSLVADWESTAPWRTLLAETERKQKQLGELRTAVGNLRSTYATLCAQHDAQAQQADKADAENEAVRQWLEQRSVLLPLFDEAATLSASLEGYHHDEQRSRGLQKQLSQSTQALPQLQEAHRAAQQAANAANAALEAKQGEIEALSKQIADLDPDGILRQRDTEAAAERHYTAAADALHALAQQQADLASRRKELAEAQSLLASHRSQAALLKEKAEASDRTYRQALGRFTTMHAGVEQTLCSLREQMVANHAASCPLCQRQISHDELQHLSLPLDADTLLAPLRQERDAAEADYKQQQASATAAATAAAQQEGTVQTLADEVEKRSQQIATSTAEAKTLLQQLDLDPTLIDTDPTLQQRLAEQAANHTANLQRLGEQQRTIADLQKQREAHEATHRTLAATAQKQRDALTTAANQVSNNQAETLRLQTEIADLNTALAQAATTLDSRLLPHYAWQNAPAEVAKQLRTDAKQYADRHKAYDARVAALAQSRALLARLATKRQTLAELHPEWLAPQANALAPFPADPEAAWEALVARHTTLCAQIESLGKEVDDATRKLADWYTQSHHSAASLRALAAREADIEPTRRALADSDTALAVAQQTIAQSSAALKELQGSPYATEASTESLQTDLADYAAQRDAAIHQCAEASSRLDADAANSARLQQVQADYKRARAVADHWGILNSHFGGERFRNTVQTHILRPLLASANAYLSHITDRYTLDCSDDNEQLSVLVRDRYNRGELRSATVLSGGEKFMVSLALSLALSSLGRDDLGINILFIDEGFGTLDQQSLDSVMRTLSSLGTLAAGRRVGIITHREELVGCIPNKIRVEKMGEGRSSVRVVYEA